MTPWWARQTTEALRKRGAASAGAGGVGIAKDKSLLHQRLLVVEHHAVQVDERFRVNEEADAIELEDPVALAGLAIEADVLALPRAPSALHPQVKPAALLGNILLGHGAAHAGDGLLCNRDALRRRRLSFLRWSCQCAYSRVFACARHGSVTLPSYAFASTAAGVAAPTPFFFFQSPMAARIASSASTEQ